MQKVQSLWYGLLCCMVKGGFTRKNAPKNKNDTSIPENEIGWSFKLSNEKIREITNTTEIKPFCEAQHLK